MNTNIARTAMTFLAATVIAGCGGSDSAKISDKDHRDFVAGCTEGGSKMAGCECVFRELTTTQGVNTEAEFKVLNKKAVAAQNASNVAAAAPPELRAATLACRSQLLR